MMKKIGKRILSVLLLIGLVVNGSHFTCTVEAAEPSQKEVIIFHTNDMHGHMDEGIGIARVAAIKKSYSKCTAAGRRRRHPGGTNGNTQQW